MNRRTYFVATGSAVFGGLAGCLGSDEYPTESFGGVDVSLASLEVEAPDYTPVSYPQVLTPKLMN